MKKQKPKTVNLGAKGSFRINHPGAFKARAKAAGLSTEEAAHKWKSAAGEKGRMARAALGLMAMSHKE